MYNIKPLAIALLIGIALGSSMTAYLESRIGNPSMDELKRAHKVAADAVAIAQQAQARSTMYRDLWLKQQRAKFAIALCERCHKEG